MSLCKASCRILAIRAWILDGQVLAFFAFSDTGNRTPFGRTCRGFLAGRALHAALQGLHYHVGCNGMRDWHRRNGESPVSGTFMPSGICGQKIGKLVEGVFLAGPVRQDPVPGSGQELSYSLQHISGLQVFHAVVVFQGAVPFATGAAGQVETEGAGMWRKRWCH